MRIRSTKSPAAGGLGVSLLAAALVLGCGHSEPFPDSNYGSENPFDDTPPVRLTYNTAADRGAAWLPDGSGIVYSAQQASRGDADVCLAVLPATGGSQRDLWCDVPVGPDRRDAVESGAPGPEGGIAFLTADGTPLGVNPVREVIAVAPTLDPRGRAEVRTFPVTPDGGLPEGTVSFLRWLDPTRLVYVGAQFRTKMHCPTCTVDTVRIGQGVSVIATDQPGGSPTALPGTAYATGVATSGNPDHVYYTLAGDTRVYRRTLSSGVTDIVHDFGPAGVVRDISLAGERLAAVVGGRVHFVVDPLFGPVQWDSGGDIHVVNLSSGEDSFIQSERMLFRRPAISPGGNAIVAEGYGVTIIRVSDAPIDFDTLVSKTSDLYLYGAP
ncbi:MAG TPA: hypothetical protein VEB59_17190 [Gemmatimonadales bacterium]|nr:hypothetical protein [Gemmatimonadales bacterium]